MFFVAGLLWAGVFWCSGLEPGCISAAVLVGAVLQSIPLRYTLPPLLGNGPKIERAYLIFRKIDGYPLIVPETVLKRAVANAGQDYELFGRHVGEGPTASGHYEQDGFGGQIYVPAGCIVNRGELYTDPRLNACENEGEQ